MTNHRWEVLAATITASMKDTNMRQADLVRESGLSLPTVRAFMTGQLRSEQPTEYTVRRLEEGLMWPAGSVARILAGEDPERVLEEQAEVIPIAGVARELSPDVLSQLDKRYPPLSMAVESLTDIQKIVDRLTALEAAVADLQRGSNQGSGG